MGITVNVNKLTVVHAGSNGTAIAFPDVCKTPSPAGPIPIPYPNIARSTDTADGSTTVKVDGNPIMLKGSNFRMSTGDEAGAALGVVSNKIKGKAEFTMYSFDVKADGKNVCRLTDPMQQNMGSGNAFGPAEIQVPLIATSPQSQACEETREKQKQQQSNEKTAWDNSGIYEGHRSTIQTVVDDFNVIIYFRATNHWCADNKWIPNHHKPKPHEVIEAKTISENNVNFVQLWLDELIEDGESKRLPIKVPRKPPIISYDAKKLYGVVMSLEGRRYGEPLEGYGSDSNGYSYVGKWITGDYDLMDIMYVGDKCRRPDQNAESEFGRIKKALNKGMGWDGIQHGPQSQWNSTPSKGDFAKFKMREEIKDWLNSDKVTPKEVPIAEGRTLSICDDKLTVVAPKNCVIYLETHEDVKKALICCGCARDEA